MLDETGGVVIDQMRELRRNSCRSVVVDEIMFYWDRYCIGSCAKKFCTTSVVAIGTLLRKLVYAISILLNKGLEQGLVL